MNSKTVAIVVPIYRSGGFLTANEKISFKHLIYFLGTYHKYLIMPKSMEVNFKGFGIKKFSDKFFLGTSTYNKLLLAGNFYEAFSKYEYILIYQLDSLVFSDNLIEWCKKGYDYIGAPWLKSYIHPSVGFSRVGNGGFSLRKIKSFLKVLDSKRCFVQSERFWDDLCTSKPKYIQYLYSCIPRKLLKRLRYFNNVKWHTRQYWSNEDYFWSDEAKRYYTEFKVAPVEAGLRFAFECAPHYCFKQNNYNLPFGCHAWSRYDRDFWKPYLLK